MIFLIILIYNRGIRTFFCNRSQKLFIVIVECIAVCEDITLLSASGMLKVEKSVSNSFDFHSRMITHKQEEVEVCPLDNLEATFLFLNLAISPLFLRKLVTLENKLIWAGGKLPEENKIVMGMKILIIHDTKVRVFFDVRKKDLFISILDSIALSEDVPLVAAGLLFNVLKRKFITQGYIPRILVTEGVGCSGIQDYEVCTLESLHSIFLFLGLDISPQLIKRLGEVLI